MIKFIFWTLPFGGIFALLCNLHSLNAMARGYSDGQKMDCPPGCAVILGKVLLTAAFWFGIFILLDYLGAIQP